MKQYLNVLRKILDEGVEKESGRANMPNTIGISNAQITMDLSEGFPLLTTKKMFLKGVINELIWFLKGDTNIKFLVDRGVNIWTDEAYKWYLETWNKYDDTFMIENGLDSEEPWSKENFIDLVKKGELYQTAIHSDYVLGDLGKVYGAQWRNQNGVDQVRDVLNGLKNNPYSRYHIIDSWNKADFKEMALPPCHLLYQFIVRPLTNKERLKYVPTEVCVNGNLEQILETYSTPKFYLDLNMYQRSCDTFLGVPFNIASISLLLMIFAKASNMVPGVANWIGGDTHLYVTHIDQVREQLSRQPFKLPTVNIKADLNGLIDIVNLKYEDFELVDYKYYPHIKADLSVGL